MPIPQRINRSSTIFQNGVSIPNAAEENRVTIFIHSPFKKGNDSPAPFATITGYLTKEFQYSAKGNYTNVFDVSPISSLPLKVVSDETQRNLANYGYLTKKMYTKGESPTVTVEFRCYADDGMTKIDGSSKPPNPIKVANYLIAMTTPQIGFDGILMFDRMTLKNSEDRSTLAFDDSTSVASIIANTINDFTSRKPPVCKLTIGNIFKKDQMVVRSVDTSVSMQFKDQGIPLYVDITVTFESLFDSVTIDNDNDNNFNEVNEEIFGTGLNFKNDSRVTFKPLTSDEMTTGLQKIQTDFKNTQIEGK